MPFISILNRSNHPTANEFGVQVRPCFLARGLLYLWKEKNYLRFGPSALSDIERRSLEDRNGTPLSHSPRP